MIFAPLQCLRCKHLSIGRSMTCTAFPDEPGIPHEILKGLDHRLPYPNDNGIRWEPSAPGVKHPLEEKQ